jgi:hypothetical protein
MTATTATTTTAAAGTAWTKVSTTGRRSPTTAPSGDWRKSAPAKAAAPTSKGRSPAKENRNKPKGDTTDRSANRSPQKRGPRAAPASAGSARACPNSRPAKRTNSNTSGNQRRNSGNEQVCPYSGSNPIKDRIDGDGAVVYFDIRKACNEGNDNVNALRKLLPSREHVGRDFGVWPRQHLLLHGLVKQGCVSCVEYLVTELGFDPNSCRLKDGCTPLHIAHFNLKAAQLQRMVQLLVVLKANPALKNKWGETPCSEAAQEATAPAPAAAVVVVVAASKSPLSVADVDLSSSDLTELVLEPPAVVWGTSPSPRSLGESNANAARAVLCC